MPTVTRPHRRAYLAALCRNVPYHLSERVLDDPSPTSVETQEFDGSVLYADLVGFTALCERLANDGPLAVSRLSDLLTSFFERLLNEAIFTHDGYVIHFGGDGMTVIFRDDEHELRAVAAADKAQRVTAELAASHPGTPLRIRIGVAAGPARLMVVGDQIQRLVITGGDAGHLALELQQRADPGSILIGPEMYRALGDNIKAVEVAADAYEVESVNCRPSEVPIRELGGRIDDFIEEKIALLEPFVPPPLATRLRQMPDGWRIEGELRRVVIVFAELDGFSKATQDAGFEVARNYLRIHRRFGGVQLKIDLTPTGHRTMTLFGLHSPTENDAERAVLAALESATYIKNVAASGGPALDLRIGVHVGNVYFGAIGSPYRYDITVIGDAVNVASRAAAAASSFQVFVTGDVAADLRADFTTTKAEPLAFKGAEEAVEMVVVHGVSGGRARYVQRRRQSRKMAGRDRELAALRDAADSSFQGHAEVIGVCGAPGIGKSFLLAPLIDRWMDKGGLGILGRCSYSTRGLPLEPVRSMFAGYLGLGNGGSVDSRRKIIAESFGDFDLGEGGQDLVEFLAHADGQSFVEADGDFDWMRVIGAVERFVRQRVDQVPVLYILEDLHFADSHTVRLAQLLSTIPHEKNFLFVATYRPSPDLADLRQTLDRELVLETLGLRDTSLLIAQMLNAETVDDSVTGFLWERSKGNPGHLTELVRFLRDRGLLFVRAQNVTVPPPGLPLLEEAVPANLAQFALGRIEHLGEVERRLLRIASSIGRSFGKDVLAQVAGGGLDSDELEHGVVSLVDEGVISPEISRRPSYRFREEITRAVTYSTIPESERREYHRRIADVLEKLAETDVDRSAVTLARHRERGRQFSQAARWYERAIRMAVFANLDEETRYLVSQWEKVVAELPRDEQPSVRSIAAMAVHKVVATARHGLASDALEIGNATIDAYWDVLDTHERSLLDLWMGASLQLVARKVEARRALKRAFDRSTDANIRCDAALRSFKCFDGVEVEAKWWLDRAAELALPGSPLALRVELARACLVADEGRLDEARIINARVRDEARKRDHLKIAGVAASNLADCDLLSGDVEDALRGFEESMIMARALGSRTDDAIDQLNVGICHLYLGRPERALGYLESAVAIASEAGDQGTETEARVHLGLALALTEDIDAGERLCVDARQRSRTGGLVDMTGALHLLHIAILRGDRELVHERLRDVEKISQDEMIPLLRTSFEVLKRKAARVTSDRND